MLSLVNGNKIKEEKVEEQTHEENQEPVQNKALEQSQEEQSSKNILGKSLEIDGTEFIVDSISGQNVSLRDTSMATIYPIFRSEKLSKINRLLKEQENTRDKKINNVIIDKLKKLLEILKLMLQLIKIMTIQSLINNRIIIVLVIQMIVL